ncbi:MAG: LuxR C-terminal-related transcriptional regulator [Chloroflexota bacterium]
MLNTLLQTKLYRPPVPQQWVQRPRLQKLLGVSHETAAAHKLTLVAAPAGFGKSTLVSRWLEESSIPSAWLSLDEYDSDPVLFLSYVVATIRTVYADACSKTAGLLQGNELPPLTYQAMTLLNDLVELDGNLVLVLDDYHVIVEQSIHQLVNRLIDQLPQHVHLILISRTEPPLPLSRLRVRQHMVEVRATDLSFSIDEAHSLFSQSLDVCLGQETIRILQERTEGWIAGLQLAVLSLRDLADETLFVQTLSSGNRYIMEYLLDEVLTHQPPIVRDFLLYTSILDRFCAPLCEAILGNEWVNRMVALMSTSEQNSPLSMGTTGAAIHALLKKLTQINLFLIRLDHEGQWYRYHHLFGDLLRHSLHIQLSTAEIAVLHQRAGMWLAEQGLIDEALNHYLSGGDHLAAAKLVERHRQAMLNQEDFHTLKRWLSHLSFELIQKRPRLLVAKAWTAYGDYQLKDVIRFVQQAEETLENTQYREDDTWLSIRGELDALKGAIAFWQGDTSNLLHWEQRALAKLPGSHEYVRMIATVGVALGHHFNHDTESGLHVLQEALNRAADSYNRFSVAIESELGNLQFLTGSLHQSVFTLKHNLSIASENQPGIGDGWTYIRLGAIHYEWNMFDEALTYYLACMENVHLIHRKTAFICLRDLAMTYLALGQFEKIQETVEQLFDSLREFKNGTLINEGRALQIWLSLQEDKLSDAEHQITALNIDDSYTPTDVFIIPPLVYARFLIVQSSPDGLTKARQILREQHQIANKNNNIWQKLQVLSTQALLEQTFGRKGFDYKGFEWQRKAIETIKEAVALAEPGGFIRTFVDFGPPMAQLLKELLDEGYESNYLRMVLKAFADDSTVARPIQPAKSTPPAPKIEPMESLQSASVLVEPLTERELETLGLLAQRLSNKEIALALDISPLTVKRHTTNIYGKLGVKGRRQAVVEAERLGILPIRQ